jgi:hypothetical protein
VRQQPLWLRTALASRKLATTNPGGPRELGEGLPQVDACRIGLSRRPSSNEYRAEHAYNGDKEYDDGCCQISP